MHPGKGAELPPSARGRGAVMSTDEQPSGKGSKVPGKPQMAPQMWKTWHPDIPPLPPPSSPSPGPAGIKSDMCPQLGPFFKLLTVSNATLLVHTTSVGWDDLCASGVDSGARSAGLKPGSATNSLRDLRGGTGSIWSRAWPTARRGHGSELHAPAFPRAPQAAPTRSENPLSITQICHCTCC